MADLVPKSDPPVTGPVLTALGTDPASPVERLKAFAAQPSARRMLPWFLGAAALGVTALAWSALAPDPQRALYTQLSDSERASVVQALDTAGIGYAIDNASGTLSVDEADFYRARMLVASDGALASPQGGAELLDSLPMGASRMLEGERLRAARERDLMLTIREIDGVESVRVHLAEGEKSVFVRDNVAPSASVMLRLARGRQLSASQVSAIVNMVAASVPGLSLDAVRVVDQHGRLLSDPATQDSDRLDLQARMEEKLRTQLAALLTPMLGEGNFSSEIQVELDMDEVTSARESYDKDGVVRSETQAQSQSAAAGQASGVPGVLANTPPPPTEAREGPPEGNEPQATQTPINGETSSSRTYELGREVSVANSSPGGIKRLSVAVAISKEAMKGGKKADIDQVRQLVSAAVGANTQRGDQVAVVVRAFEPETVEDAPFYEAPWFATVVRYGASLLAVLLVLLLGVRPLLKALRRGGGEAQPGDAAEGSEGSTGEGSAHALPPPTSPADLTEKVDLAQQFVSAQPDKAVAALRQMLAAPDSEAEAVA
jgi:flagellar M-ring protein FliF